MQVRSAVLSQELFSVWGVDSEEDTEIDCGPEATDMEDSY
jgi:hypothetical protein